MEQDHVDMHQTIQKYINEEIRNGDSPVGIDEDLLSDGMIDSISMVRLITFIEETCAIEIPPEDLIIENFETIRVMVDYLQKRRP